MVEHVISDSKAKDVYAEYWDDMTYLSTLRGEMLDDYDFYLGNQWEKVKKKQGKPYLTINLIKKPVDLLSGYHRQNRTDLKVYPVEGGDENTADIHTQILRWMLSGKAFFQQLAMAFEDALICGIGWIHPYVDYSYDMINGDIKVMREDPFKIVFDPYMNSIDLSDCTHIFRRAFISKTEAMAMYPKYAKEIKEMKGSEESKLEPDTSRSFGAIGDRLNLLEKWHRVVREKKFVIDLETGDSAILENEDMQLTENMRVVKKKVSTIEMVRLLEDLPLYDGASPYLDTMYPFIPIFCDFKPTYPEWEYKLQGVVRPLKDLQLEKNKRRSQIMEFILTKNIKGYWRLRSANIDMDKFLTGDSQVIDVDTPNDIGEFNPAKIPDALVMLEKENNADILMVGPNADLMGFAGSDQGSAASAPGVTLQLRQRQGLTQVQAQFDFLSHAYEMLGIYIIELVNKNWNTQKIKKIVGENAPFVKEEKELRRQAQQLTQMPVQQGQEAEFKAQADAIFQQLGMLKNEIEAFWAGFDEARDEARYDVRVGEVQSTPSYKLAILETLTRLKHQGVAVPDNVYIEFLDIPERLRDEWIESNRAQSEAAQAMQQQAIQAEMSMEQLKAQVKIAVQELANEGDIAVAQIRAKDVYESKLEITKKGNP
jgi:hypothetical protein